jgi:hypothetical protein
MFVRFDFDWLVGRLTKRFDLFYLCMIQMHACIFIQLIPPNPIQKQGLSNLVSTTALALLRSSNDWVSAYGESRQFGKGEGKAEAEYSRLAVRERSKVR